MIPFIDSTKLRLTLLRMFFNDSFNIHCKDSDKMRKKGQSCLKASRKRISQKSLFLCHLLYNGSKKPDNCGRFHREEKKMIQLLKRNWEYKGQLVWNQNAGLLMKTVIEFGEPWGCQEPFLSTNHSPLSFWVFMFSVKSLVYFWSWSIFFHFSIKLVFMSSPATLRAILFLSLLFVHLNHSSLYFGSVCAGYDNRSSPLSLFSHTSSSHMYVMPLI